MIRPILNARLDGASTIPATGTLTASSGSTVDLSLATVTLPASITSTFFDFKGNQSASGNPNYPAGAKGDVYYINVAGKVGGASGKTVTVGDMLICSADNAGGAEASVGTSWFVTESNLDMTNVAITGGSITGITDITVADGGTGRSTGTTAYALVATGTTATGAQQTLASGATTEVLVGGGASALPVWTTATGTGAPVRAIAPAFTGAPTISGNTASPNGTITTIGDELWSLHRVRTIGAFLFGNTGTSSNAAETGARGGALCSSGSSTSGYGRATLAQSFNQTSSSGGGIRFNKAISVAGVAGIYCGASATSRTRLVVGGNGGVPATADANALAVVGFGVEFRFLSTEDCECQLFAHNGTTYATSGWSGAIAGGLNRITAFIVASDGAGNIALYLSYGTGAAGRPSSTAILTLAGGPTTQGNTTNNRIDWIATNDSTGSPSASTATLFSALLDTP